MDQKPREKIDKRKLRRRAAALRKKNIIGETPWNRTEGYNEAVDDFLKLIDEFHEE